MTASLSWRRAGFVGVRVTGEIGHFLDLATEQTVPLGALDPELVEMLLTAVDTASFFTRPELPSGSAGLEIRIWHVRGYAMTADRGCWLVPSRFQTPLSGGWSGRTATVLTPAG